jgi:serine/threonine protein kinase
MQLRIVQAKAPKLNLNRITPDYTSINMMNNLNEINNDDYQIVAVKMLKSSLASQRKFLKRNLIKEAYLMAQFNHPNLIKLLGISITPQDHIFLLFEYMSKGNILITLYLIQMFN